MTSTDFAIFDEGPWLAGGPGRLGAAAGVPTMLAHEEQLLCHWLGAEWASGWGALVDIGSFVGGPVARMAEGARGAGKTLRFHAFDRFAVSEAHKAQFLYSKGVPPFEGEDARGVVTDLLAPWGDAITLHAGELKDATWDREAAIEVLYIDATKSTVTTDAIARVFYPALRPGSVVVQRGALHWREPWVAVHMARLGAVFEPIGHATDDALIFGCVEVPEAATLDAARLDGITDEDMFRTLLDMREVFARFGTEDRLVDLIDAVERSPGKRAAWQMVARPG